MEIIKTNAIVLRSLKHTESSLIVSFFTEVQGKISVIAKGARKTKPRVPFDTFSLMNIVYRSKASREVQLLTQAELLNAFLPIRDDWGKTVVALGMCELVEKTTEVADPNPELFQIMEETLRGLNEARANPRNFFWHFQLGLIQTLGFGLILENCTICARETEKFPTGNIKFLFENGGLICPECKVEKKVYAILKPGSLKVLHFLFTHGLDKLDRLKPSILTVKEIDALLMGFLRYHIEGLKVLKSKELISRI